MSDENNDNVATLQCKIDELDAQLKGMAFECDGAFYDLSRMTKVLMKIASGAQYNRVGDALIGVQIQIVIGQDADVDAFFLNYVQKHERGD